MPGLTPSESDDGDAFMESFALRVLEAELKTEIASELRRGYCGQNLPRLRHLQAALGRVRQRQAKLAW